MKSKPSSLLGTIMFGIVALCLFALLLAGGGGSEGSPAQGRTFSGPNPQGNGPVRAFLLEQ